MSAVHMSRGTAEEGGNLVIGYENRQQTPSS